MHILEPIRFRTTKGGGKREEKTSDELDAEFERYKKQTSELRRWESEVSVSSVNINGICHGMYIPLH